MYDDFVKEINNLRCEKGQLNSLVNSCQEKIRKLEKQVEKVLNDYYKLDEYNRTLQKSFIKWLESYLSLFDDMDIEEQARYDTILEILRKYKEISGE